MMMMKKKLLCTDSQTDLTRGLVRLHRRLHNVLLPQFVVPSHTFSHSSALQRKHELDSYLILLLLCKIGAFEVRTQVLTYDTVKTHG